MATNAKRVDADYASTTADNENQDHETMMTETVTALTEGSKIKSNGVRDVPKAVYTEQMEKHGVSKEILDRVQKATSFVNTAAARVAVGDLEGKVGEMSKEDLKDDEKRRGLSSTVRLPTYGGSTDITVGAEARNPIPFRPDADGNGERQFSTTHGRLRVSINTKGHIHKDFHDEASSRLRKSLGLD